MYSCHLSRFQENVKDKLRAIVVTLSYSLQTPRLRRQVPGQGLPPVAPILNAHQPSTHRAEVSMGSGLAQKTLLGGAMIIAPHQRHSFLACEVPSHVPQQFLRSVGAVTTRPQRGTWPKGSWVPRQREPRSLILWFTQGSRLMWVCHFQMWLPRPLGHLRPGQHKAPCVVLMDNLDVASSLSLHLLNLGLSYLQGRLGKYGLALDQPASFYCSIITLP